MTLVGSARNNVKHKVNGTQIINSNLFYNNFHEMFNYLLFCC